MVIIPIYGKITEIIIILKTISNNINNNDKNCDNNIYDVIRDINNNNSGNKYFKIIIIVMTIKDVKIIIRLI